MELRSSMSSSAICSYFGLDWDTVKELEKRNLAREYAHIRLKDVHAIGVDEIFVGRALVEEGGLLTIVRDLESGAVLFVGEGRGADTLAAFGRRLRASGASIDYVTMDMSAPFAKMGVGQPAGRHGRLRPFPCDQEDERGPGQCPAKGLRRTG